jgi:pilus assembly protein Flp/PilA
MWRVASKIRRCLASEGGPTAVEYAVMTAFVIAVLIGIITAFGNNATVQFTTVSSALS